MNIQSFLRAVLFTPGYNGRWGLPILFEGKPGTGKTSQVEHGAKAAGLPCTTIISSLREPSDFLGPMFPSADGKHVVHLIPPWAHELLEAEHGVGFFDEIKTTAPSTQAALLRVVLEGVVGDVRLPNTVRFLAACNSTEDSAGGYDLAPPIANRFGHIAWEAPSGDAWGDWLLGAGSQGEGDEKALDPRKEESRVIAAWASPYAKARGLVAGFIRKRPNLLLAMPKANDPAQSKAWPSPRTWEFASRALAGAEIHDLGPVEADELVAAFIGAGAAGELATYRSEADLPDPADVLDGKVSFKHDPRRLDRTLAVFSSCAALVTSPKAEKREERAGKLWQLLGTAAGDAADIAVPAGKALVKAKLSSVPEAKPVLVKLQPILMAAGIQ